MDRPSHTPIPLPSHIHYELLLQLLERETSGILKRGTEEHRQLQELVATLRRALAVQKQLEASCQNKQLPIEYHWSLNLPAVGPLSNAAKGEE
ncbi:MAG: DUF5340 family protein [Limnothrix sp. BL-A-16]|jgi:Family of unknown function (DUF5340)